MPIKKLLNLIISMVQHSTTWVMHITWRVI